MENRSSLRLGLCCTFRDEPIKFYTTTVTAIARMERAAALAKLSQLCLTNAESLLAALVFCHSNGIGCFRVNSQILPIKTHREQGYEIGELPEAEEIVGRFRACREFAERHDLRLSFHPDQFVVLNSQRADVVAASVRELEYQAEVAEWVGADVVNIHAGGVFGDKAKALADFARSLSLLSAQVRSRLTVENDDGLFAPSDLLPLCLSEGIPLVYDVHHHRCYGDGLSVEEATERARATWNREPLFHISSPLEGWTGPKPERHSDFIAIKDFPLCWQEGQEGQEGKSSLTVEVEAKAKEVAVLALQRDLSGSSTIT